MEFLEDETRPRFLFQSRPTPASSPAASAPASNQPLLILCFSLSLILIAASLFLLHSDLLRSLSLWISISLLLGPLAPPSFTGGHVRVGSGHVVDFPQPQQFNLDDPRKRRLKPKRSEELGLATNTTSDSNPFPNGSALKHRSNSRNDGSEIEKDSAEWTDEDINLLKKQMIKNPVGKPRRWEVIAEAFDGRHGVHSVINMSKSMGDAKPEDSDSYSKFLKNRKPIDKRADDQHSAEGAVSDWSSGEDIALLNALKTFPKEAAMRWDKIAAAVPGKTKAACIKRVTDLKRDFRSSKSAAAADS